MRIEFENAINYVGADFYAAIIDEAIAKLAVLDEGNGAGNDFLGWINLPQSYTCDDIEQLRDVSASFARLDAVVIVGIGGSYLGAKAAIEALKPHFHATRPEILYAGNNLSGNYHAELLEYLQDKDYGVVVISKSGTTTEPAIAFRLLLSDLMQRVDAATLQRRVVAVTDASRGALRELAEAKSFKTFVIPDNVGGRFSVLSPVGLLPVAIAGFDIDELLQGASIAQDVCFEWTSENPAIRYAAIRNALYRKGKKIELLVNYNPRLNYFAEWWKQLFGESEGKNNMGLFPASASFTTDLHSLGQYVQQGERHLFETVVFVDDDNDAPIIPHDDNDLDKLNYLAGKDMEFVNAKAAEGTAMAHVDGGVPNIRLNIDTIDEYNLGFLMYFFEMACGISGYMLGVNPFDQPGVELYKKNMFTLLGRK